MANPPKYVIDRVYGGAPVPFEQILGPEGAASDMLNAGGERVWPRIPSQYELPATRHEDTVKECTFKPSDPSSYRALIKKVRYILGQLQETLLPSPLLDDDLELMSDFLLSIETRAGLTSHVLLQTEARQLMISLANTRENEEASKFSFKARGSALLRYWDDLSLQKSKLSPAEALADTPIPPLKEELPAEKASDWKLSLTEDQAREAQEDYDAFKDEKMYTLKYLKANPPRPMAWAPKDGDAWKTVNRAKLESGDLYDNPNFKPIYPDWHTQPMDALFWTDPDATAEELAEMKDGRNAVFEQMRRTTERREAREARRKLLRSS
jgi:hypothetical protein